MIPKHIKPIKGRTRPTRASDHHRRHHQPPLLTMNLRRPKTNPFEIVLNLN